MAKVEIVNIAYSYFVYFVNKLLNSCNIWVTSVWTKTKQLCKKMLNNIIKENILAKCS